MSVLDLERWKAASPYLDRALEFDEEGREALLAALAQDDPALAADLRKLLTSHRALLDGGFLEQEASALPDLLVSAGQMIGPYELVSPLGEGGMGTVWLAERRDGRFERRVAIKLLNVGLVGLPAGKRFLREGAVLAQLRHPSIAGLIDAGVLSGGRPYLVLEYVDGEPIDRHCDQRELGIDERIRLVLDVASAVEHAHAHLVVHRDLKPANVLVARSGEVKLLDFGIAKLLAAGDRPPAATQTRAGGGALTPEYAAPEQLTDAPVSTATDVYALGVLLYVLLSGRHPAGDAMQTPAGMVRAILDTVPVPVSTAATSSAGDPGLPAQIAERRGTSPERLQWRLQGDLDTIVAKALKKEPVERYATVGPFAADLRRYLAHQPISARPDSFAYRARKFARRNRGVVAASVLTVLATVAGVAATLVQADVARRQRDFALAQLERAEALNDLNNFLLVDAAPGGKPFTVTTLLQHAERIVQRQQSSSAARANLLIGIGGQYAAMEEIEESQRVLEQAYATSRLSAVPTVRANAACNLAETLVLAGESERARRLVEEGLAELPAGSEYDLDRASCLMHASRVAREAGSPEQAIELLRAAREARSRAPYRSEMLDLRTEIDLAESYNQAGRFREANASFEQAGKRLAALGRDETLAAGTLYNNWALSLGLLGRPLDAEPLFRRAIDLSRDDETNDAVAPMLLINYARTLREISRLDEAHELAEEAYGRARSAGHEVVVNQSLLVRATIYRELGRLEQARAMLDEVAPRLRAALPAGHYAFASLALERAQLELARGHGDRARELIDEGVAIAEADRQATGRTHAVPRLLVRRAEILVELGEHEPAVDDATQALEILQADAPPDLRTSLIGQAYLARGRAALALGHPRAGAPDLAAALKHLESAIGQDHPQTRLVRALIEQTGPG